MEKKQNWTGTIEDLKAKFGDSIEDSGGSLTSKSDIGVLSCDTEVTGTCVRGGKTGERIKYTCHDSSGNAHSFYVCDISGT
jgi:hypothetical protein